MAGKTTFGGKKDPRNNSSYRPGKTRNQGTYAGIDPEEQRKRKEDSKKSKFYYAYNKEQTIYSKDILDTFKKINNSYSDLAKKFKLVKFNFNDRQEELNETMKKTLGGFAKFYKEQFEADSQLRQEMRGLREEVRLSKTKKEEESKEQDAITKKFTKTVDKIARDFEVSAEEVLDSFWKQDEFFKKYEDIAPDMVKGIKTLAEKLMEKRYNIDIESLKKTAGPDVNIVEELTKNMENELKIAYQHRKLIEHSETKIQKFINSTSKMLKTPMSFIAKVLPKPVSALGSAIKASTTFLEDHGITHGFRQIIESLKAQGHWAVAVQEKLSDFILASSPHKKLRQAFSPFALITSPIMDFFKESGLQDFVKTTRDKKKASDFERAKMTAQSVQGSEQLASADSSHFTTRILSKASGFEQKRNEKDEDYTERLEKELKRSRKARERKERIKKYKEEREEEKRQERKDNKSKEEEHKSSKEEPKKEKTQKKQKSKKQTRPFAPKMSMQEEAIYKAWGEGSTSLKDALNQLNVGKTTFYDRIKKNHIPIEKWKHHRKPVVGKKKSVGMFDGIGALFKKSPTINDLAIKGQSGFIWLGKFFEKVMNKKNKKKEEGVPSYGRKRKQKSKTLTEQVQDNTGSDKMGGNLNPFMMGNNMNPLTEKDISSILMENDKSRNSVTPSVNPTFGDVAKAGDVGSMLIARILLKKGLGEEKGKKPKKSLLDWLDVLGDFTLASLGFTKILPLLKKTIPFLSKALPIIGIVAGVAWGVLDGLGAMKKSKEWGTSKGAAFIGGFFAGPDSKKTWMGAFKNMGKWALMGAGIGFFAGGGPIGALIGGIAGAAMGGLLYLIGGKNIAKFADGIAKVGKWIWKGLKDIDRWITDTYKKIGDFFSKGFKSVVDWISTTATNIGDWLGKGIGDAWEFVKTATKDIISWITSPIQSVINTFKNIIAPLTEGEKEEYKKLDFFGKINFVVDEMFSRMSKSVKEFFTGTSMGQFLKNSILNPISNFFNKIGDMFTYLSDPNQAGNIFEKSKEIFKGGDAFTGYGKIQAEKRRDDVADSYIMAYASDYLYGKGTNLSKEEFFKQYVNNKDIQKKDEWRNNLLQSLEKIIPDKFNIARDVSSIQDGIVTNRGQIIQLSPDDNIIATKNSPIIKDTTFTDKNNSTSIDINTASLEKKFDTMITILTDILKKDLVVNLPPQTVGDLDRLINGSVF